MDKKVMDVRLKSWIPVFEEQARSGLTKQLFARKITLSVAISFTGSAKPGNIFLINKRKQNHQVKLQKKKKQL